MRALLRALGIVLALPPVVVAFLVVVVVLVAWASRHVYIEVRWVP